MRRVARIILKLVKAVALLLGLIVAIPLVGLAWGFLTTSGNETPLTSPGSLAGGSVPSVYAEDETKWLRAEDNTFLTYPEWSIVYAARDYAAVMETSRESAYPYFSYASRYWQDYARVIRATSGYPFNSEYHTMLLVIGTSQTIEYVLQGVWENTVGRVTEWLSGAPTPQDLLRARGARDYAVMLDSVPWFEFDYRKARSELWNSPSANGLAAIRSWERKLAFGTSDSFKIFYAGLIKSGLESTSGETELDIAIWAEGPVASAIEGEENTRLLRTLTDGSAVFVTRRYQVFTEMAPRLIARGLRFREIAGNDEMMVTLLSDGGNPLPEGTKTFFASPVAAGPQTWRTAIVLPVATLHETLPALAASGFTLEHLYDF